MKVLNEPRPGKKLLVVDIDYTIFDLGSSAERPEELARCVILLLCWVYRIDRFSCTWSGAPTHSCLHVQCACKCILR